MEEQDNNLRRSDNGYSLSEITNRAKLLEKDIKLLQMENKDLTEKYDLTQNNVSDFVSEMGSILDSHDIGEALSQMMMSMGLGNLEEQNLPNQIVVPDEIVNDDHIQPHAGTGGSSKMKSRPRR